MLSALSLTAQYTVAGTILDQAGEVVAIGDAILYKTDSIFSHAGILDGIFRLDSIPTGDYLLEIRCLGFESLQIPTSIQTDINKTYTLTEDSKLLEEITVSALRESVRYEDGNIQINMVNSIFAQQPSTLDALTMLPGIITDPVSRAISLIGGGSPLLYIGNRNITLDELMAIPVTSIKTVEIIYNPSAKYEANGRSVLLITLLQNLDDGIRVELTENAVQRRRLNNYLGYNMSVRKGQFELRNNFNYNLLQLWEGGNSQINIPSKGIRTSNDYLSLGLRPQFVGGVGLHYQLSERDYLSINGNFRTQNTTADLTSSSITAINSIIDSVDVASEDNADRDFYTANINYNTHIRSTTIFSGLQWSQYHRGLRNTIWTDRLATGRVPTQFRDQDFDINVLAGRVDIEQPLAEDTRLEVGTNIYRGDALAYQHIEDLAQSTPLQRDYEYKEHNYAFYGQVSGRLYDVNYTLGVRTESTDFYGKFADEVSPLIDRQQTNVFPRANLSFRIDSLSSVNINFSSSISRPDYLNASSITTYITPYIEYERNINLVPSPARYLSVNYQYGQQSFNITAYTRDNLVQQSAYFDEESERIITGPENFDLERGINLRINNRYNYKRWSVNTSARFVINQLQDQRGEAVAVTPFLYLYANNRFALPKRLAISINAYHITARNSGIYFRNSRFVLGASLTKTWGPVTLSLNATDILRKMNFEETYTVNGIENSTVYLGDVKSFAASIRYTFGRTFRSNYQNDAVDENLNRLQ